MDHGIYLCALNYQLRGLLSFLRYYRYNEDMRAVDPDYPKPISKWQGVPDGVTAAIMSKDQSTYSHFLINR